MITVIILMFRFARDVHFTDDRDDSVHFGIQVILQVERVHPKTARQRGKETEKGGRYRERYKTRTEYEAYSPSTRRSR